MNEERIALRALARELSSALEERDEAQSEADATKKGCEAELASLRNRLGCESYAASQRDSDVAELSEIVRVLTAERDLAREHLGRVNQDCNDALIDLGLARQEIERLKRERPRTVQELFPVGSRVRALFDGSDPVTVVGWEGNTMIVEGSDGSRRETRAHSSYQLVSLPGDAS